MIPLSLALLTLLCLALCSTIAWRLGWSVGFKAGHAAERKERILKRAASLLHRTERKLSLIQGGDDAA